MTSRCPPRGSMSLEGAGVVTQYAIDNRIPTHLAPGPSPDGNLWFLENVQGIAKVASLDVVTGSVTKEYASELFHVDVHELAGMAALVAVGRLGRRKPRALAEADAPQPKRDRRGRKAENLGDLGAGHPHSPERLDRVHQAPGHSRGAAVRARAAVRQALIALFEALHPLHGGAHAAAGGLGRRPQRPALFKHAGGDQSPALRTGVGVSVKVHPVSSLGLGGLDTPSLQGGPDEQRG